MVKPPLASSSVHYAHPPVDADLVNSVVTIQPTQSPTGMSTLRQPSTLPEIFVHSVLLENHIPDHEEAELNVLLDLCIYVDVV